MMIFIAISILIGIFMAFQAVLGNIAFIVLCAVLLYKRDFRLLFFALLITFSFFRYTSGKLYMYDTKYMESSFSDIFTIVSFEKETSQYRCYVAKNKEGDRFLLYFKKSEMLEVQNVVSVEGELIMPDLARNSGGFNQRRNMNARKIFGSIMVSKVNVVQINQVDFITCARRKIEEIFKSLLPSDDASVISAMINGNKKQVSQTILDDFKNSGVSHLLAVSGTHVTYVVLFLEIASKRLFGTYMSYYISIIGIILYILVAGASASVMRAGIMAILNILAIILSRKPYCIGHLAFSFVVLLCLNPLAICDSGFVLSFMGALGMICLLPQIRLTLTKYVKSKVIFSLLAVTISAQIMLLPFIVLYYHTISVVSIVTNLLIVPVVGFLIFVGILTVLTGIVSIKLASLFSYSIYLVLQYIFMITHFLGFVPHGNIIVTTPTWVEILLYYAFLYCLVSKRIKDKSISIYHGKISLRKLMMYSFVLIALMNQLFNIFPHHCVKLNMVDVGQGDCFYIETPHHKTILIDSGGTEGSDYDVGENIVIPYLLYQKKKEVDIVVISHPHEDHIEGLFSIMEKLHVKQVIIGENLEDNELIQELMQMCIQKNTKLKMVSQGDTFVMDDVDFEVLYPSKTLHVDNLNNASLVIKMTYGQISTLFTGDLEDNTFDLGRYASDIDILKVGHHGSDTSTSDTLLKCTSPQIALISVGKRNDYGHPKKSVINKLEKYHAKIFRTDTMGEVSIKIKQDKIYVKTKLSK